MQDCRIISGLVPCDAFYRVQNLALTKTETQDIPSQYLIKLRIGNRILCFHLFDLRDYIEQNGDVFVTEFGSCLFSPIQLDRINKNLAVLGEAPVTLLMITENPRPTATKRKLEAISLVERQQEIMQVLKKARIKTPEISGYFAQLPPYLIQDIIQLVAMIISLQNDPEAIVKFCSTSKAMYELCQETVFSWPSPWSGEYKIKGFILLNRFLDLKKYTPRPSDLLFQIADRIAQLRNQIKTNQQYIDDAYQIQKQQPYALTTEQQNTLNQLLDKHEKYNIIIQQLLALVQVFIDAGIPLDKKRVRKPHNTVLHEAAKFGETKIIDKILNKNPDLANEPNQLLETPLMIAAVAGNLEAIRILINAGANINQLGPDDKTILQMVEQYPLQTTQEKRLKTLDLLRQLGAQ